MQEESINIFLDSNVLISDLYWKNNFSKSLLELKSESNIINIYASSLVLNEVNGFYERNVKSSVDRVKSSLADFNSKFLHDTLCEVNFKEVKEYVEDFNSFYKKMIDDEVVKKIEDNKDVLSEILKRAIKRLPPFFSESGRNKKKQEFRDAVIWLSYIEYIKQYELRNCFFITNNTEDFCNKNNTDLHEELKEDNGEIVIYDSIKSLIDKESLIKDIINKASFSKWLNKQDIDKKYFERYILKFFSQTLINRYREIVREKDLKEYLCDSELMAFKIVDFEKEFEIEDYKLINLGAHALAEVDVCIDSIGQEFKARYFNRETNKLESKTKNVKVIMRLTLTIRENEIHKIKDIEIFSISDKDVKFKKNEIK